MSRYAGMHQRGMIVMGIFGLLFAVAAIAFGYAFVHEPLEQVWRARGWEPVPAKLQPSSNRPAQRHSMTGAEYRYEYGGRSYAGQRVSFYDSYSGSGIDQYHAAKRSELRGAFTRGTAIQVWVNPQEPGEAVIDRTLNKELLWMPLTLCGVMAAMGLLFAYLGFFQFRDTQRSPQAAAAALSTRKPIFGSSHTLPAGIWLFALIWNGMVALMLATGMTPAPGVSVFVVWLAAGAFVAVGVFLAWKALLATLRFMRYRRMALWLDPFPGEAGGVVAGWLDVPIAYDGAQRFKVTLTATEHGVTGGNMQNDTYQRTLFEEEATASALATAGGTRLKVRIQVPAEAPASEGYGEALQWSSSTAGRVFVRWTLSVSAEVAGADVDEEFEIPVVRAKVAGTAAQAGAAAPRPFAAAMASAPVSEALLPARPQKPSFQYERSGSSILIAQPPWEKPGKVAAPGSLLGGLAFCAAFAGAGVFLFYQHQWFMGAIFFLVGAGLALAALAYLAHGLYVTIGPQGMTIERRLWGLRLKYADLHRDNIAAVEVSVDTQVQQGGSSSMSRSVSVRMLNGQTHTIAELIPGQREAIALRNLVGSRLGLGAAALTGSAEVAAPTATAQAVPQGTQAGGSKWLSMAASVAGLLLFLWWGGFFKLARDLVKDTASLTSQAPARPGWPAAVAGPFDLPPDGSQYLGKISASGVKAERHGEDVRVRVSQMKIDRMKGDQDYPYEEIGAYLIHMNPQSAYQELGVWRNREQRGTVARSGPEVRLGPFDFEFRNVASRCAAGDCWIKLYTSIRTSPNSWRGENTTAVRFLFSPTADIEVARPAPSKFWDTSFERGTEAMNAGRYPEALQFFDEAAATVQQSLGANHPAEALVLLRRSMVYGRQKDYARQEQAQLRSLQILEARSVAEVKEAAGAQGWFDKEMVARGLGDFYWEQQRYADAFTHYQKAYDAAPDLITTDYSRNLKRAFSSAGLMATACTLGKWDIADRAMTELKERYPKIEAESQRKLKYWIDTGEPRLAARKC